MSIREFNHNCPYCEASHYVNFDIYYEIIKRIIEDNYAECECKICHKDYILTAYEIDNKLYFDAKKED